MQFREGQFDSSVTLS
nr:unnamed protein product [Callosobruchus chinensis]